MELSAFRFAFDLGTAVLIWIVQLIIYPSFKYYKQTDLLAWHEIYTKKVSYLVIPLMCGQAIVAGLQLFDQINLYTMFSSLLILIVWGSTFYSFVPMHGKISSGSFDQSLLLQLERKNWFRTLIWTSLLLATICANYLNTPSLY